MSEWICKYHHHPKYLKQLHFGSALTNGHCDKSSYQKAFPETNRLQLLRKFMQCRLLPTDSTLLQQSQWWTRALCLASSALTDGEEVPEWLKDCIHETRVPQVPKACGTQGSGASLEVRMVGLKTHTSLLTHFLPTELSLLYQHKF